MWQIPLKFRFSPEYAVFIFALALLSFGFLFGIFSDTASAATCASYEGAPGEGPVWLGVQNLNCTISSQDFGGSDLKQCIYQVVDNGTITKTQTFGASEGCGGAGPVTFSVGIAISPSGDCQNNGLNICRLQLSSEDSAGNSSITKTYSYDVDIAPPSVSASNASSLWFSSRTTMLSVSDSGGSGFAQARYSWDVNTMNSTCTSGGSGTFSDGTVLSVPAGSHGLYLCAVDGAGNVYRDPSSGNPYWYSGAAQYNIDPNPPTISYFSVSPIYPPNSVTPGQPLLTVKWAVADTGGSHLKQVEIWRAVYDASLCNGTNNSGCNWGSTPEQTILARANSDRLGSQQTPYFYSYSPTGDGTYEYGIHVLDNTSPSNIKTETQDGFNTQEVRIKLTNAAPSLSSATLSPTSPFLPGTQVTFSGNWSDSDTQDGEQSKLFICKNNGVPSGGNCSGGSINNWCVSSFSLASPFTCIYTTQTTDQNTNPNSYYAFVCDNGTGSLCSPVPPAPPSNTSGTFVVDATAPTITSFSAAPSNGTSFANIANSNISISWTANDTGGSGMNHYELWRAPDNSGSPGVWAVVAGQNNLSPTATSTTDSPGNGIWWYGFHAIDNASNCIAESGSHCGGVSSDSSDPRTAKGPIKVQVDTIAPANPTCSTGGTFTNSVTVTCSGESGATLRYTTNGITPTISSTQYTTPLNFSDTTTLIIAAWDPAGNRSATPDNSYTYTITHNQPPIAAISCTPSSCTGYTSGGLIFNNNSTDPQGLSDIVQSRWDIAGFGSNPDATCNSPNALCNFTTQSMPQGSYTISLTVQDNAGATSSATKNFTILQDAVANFTCSLDGSVFSDCSTIAPAKDERVYFRDQSTPSQGASISSWSWIFQDGSPGTETSSSPSTVFLSSGSKQVSLTITDTAGRTATKQININVGYPFPQWQEISPF